MKARHFGILLLLGVSVVPLSVSGWLMIHRAERTALSEVRRGNQRVAERAARRVSAYVDSEIDRLRALSATLSDSIGLSAAKTSQVLKNYRILYPHLRALDAFAPRCRPLGFGAVDDQPRHACDDLAVTEALTDRVYRGSVALTHDFAMTMTIGVPLDIAGETVGALVADVDLVGLWPAVNEVHVGQSGRARLVAADGTLIAHGDPEERRRVFLRETDPFAAKVRAGGDQGARYPDSQGREVLAVSAHLHDPDWLLIVEEPVAEAFSGSALMSRDLLGIVAVAAVVAVVLGLVVGGLPVRSLERLRAHAHRLGSGDFEARVALPRLPELRSLAQAMNDMGARLKELQETIRANERLTTFAQVASGLAHDLMGPITDVWTACDEAVKGQRSADDVRQLLAPAAERHLPKLARFVTDLRRLARKGTVPMDLAQIEPVQLSQEVIRDIASDARWKELGIEFAVTGHAPLFIADRSLFERALINLVKNAADACAEKEINGEPGLAYAVAIDVSEDPQTNIVFTVTDTGRGIEPERLADLFKNELKSTKHTTGVGLGLSVVRQVAHAHGGHLRADSVVGQGSTFRIIVPKVPPTDENLDELSD